MATQLTKVVLGAAAAVAVAAGGWFGWQHFQQRGSSSLPTNADIGSEAPFAFSDCKPRLMDGTPAIAISFTQALDRSQDFSTLVKATEGEKEADAKPVAARWVLGDNPRVLYLPFVQPDRTFRIQLAAELMAKSGGKLVTPQSCTVKSEAMPASFYFASKGVVLPAGLNGGLPVVTVNVAEVDVQFLRVKPAALSNFLEQVGGRPVETKAESTDGEGDEGRYYGGYYDDGRKLKGTVGGYVLDQLREMSDSVYIGRFTTDARNNRRNVNFLPVEGIKELQEPGIYVAVMSQPGRFGWDYQVTHYYVTDIGLHVRRHPTQLDVFTTSLKKGTSIGGIELALIDESGKTLAQAQTDGEGHAVFQGRTDKARAVLARSGNKEMSLLSLREPALDLSEFEATGYPSRNNKLFVYAGRDLYRPGESFKASVLARDADGRVAAKPLPLTLTLKKPDGSTASQQLLKPQDAGQGYYERAVALPTDAPTGRWTLQARVDPAAKLPDAQWTFQVEEFLPERMKLQLTADEGFLYGKGGETSLEVKVQGDYLYGAPAAGNRLQASVFVERALNPLAKQLPGFLFGDFADDKARAREDLPEEELSPEGAAEVQLTPKLAERHSPMLLRGAFSLLESGGRPVVRSIERTWWPAAQLVGIRPLFASNVAQERSLAEFELTRVDGAARFVAAKGLKLKLVQENREWYWRYDEGRGWNSGYNTTEEVKEERTLDLAARSKVSLPVEWGRYRLEISDPSTGLTSRYFFYAGWGAQDAEDMGNRPDRVKLDLHGAPFKPGQTVHLGIKPPHDGEALVTVEGDRVLWSKRLSVRAAGTDLDIAIPKDDPAWNRHDLYITVAAFRPGSQGDRVTPARALGLAYLPLSAEDRKINVALAAPAKISPDQPLAVTVKAPQLAGKPAIVTVSAVDVGILNITRYKTPDPFDFFFGKHRYDADLLDIYGKLIESMDGSAAKQRFGGDAGKRDSQSMPRKVLLVDLFSGPVVLDAKGEAKLSLKLPDFNGTLRLMAVVSSADSYGSAQQETVVAAPLVAELSMPRFVSPGDKATIALDLTNLSGAAQTVSVNVEASGPLRITGKPEPVQLADKQRRILLLQAEATDATGLVPIKIDVAAGKIKIHREMALEVVPVTPMTHEIKRQRLEAGASMTIPANALDAYWAGGAGLNVTLSNVPPIDVRAQVKGLLTYPYGCLEQTTSSSYPLVLIDDEAAKAFGLTPLSREERAKRLEGAFSHLATMQQAQGGFGLWNASSPYEAWLSAYATSFLIDARDAGFAVPENLLKKAMDSLSEQFQRAPGFQMQPPKNLKRDAGGRYSDYREVESLRLAHQRFAEAAVQGYILARSQKAPLATLRTLFEQYRGNARSPLPLIHLGLALRLMGDEARAKTAFEEAVNRPYGIQPQSSNYYWGEWMGDYGSRVRDLSLGYALLVKHDIKVDRRENLLFDLAADFDKRSYYSTQERISLFMAANAARSGSVAGEEWRANLAGEALGGKLVQSRSVAVAKLKAGAVLKNEGTSALFVETAAQGYPIKPPAPQSDVIRVERTLWTTAGVAVTRREFKTGDMFIVRLRVSARQLIRDGMVVDRIPAGFEIENLAISQGPQAGEFKVEDVNIAAANANPNILHMEYRDDRFVAAAKLGQGNLDVFYLVRAVTPGRYVVPATFAEDMYRPELRGVGNAEADITVTGK